MSPHRAPSPLLIVTSVLGFVAFWAVLAWARADASVLPSPLAVAGKIAEEAARGELMIHISATLSRVAVAFAVAMSLGSIIGIAMGQNETLDRWFGAWLVIFLNIPALVVIVLCYLWIGLNEIAAITAVALNKTAMVAVTLREGMYARDPKLAEMAQAFEMSAANKLRHVVLPQLWPFFAASMRNGLAIIWKIVLVVEFLGRGNGVGFQIHLYFQLFDIETVLAYALSFVVVMLIIEYGIIGLFERHATRWKTTAPA